MRERIEIEVDTTTEWSIGDVRERVHETLFGAEDDGLITTWKTAVSLAPGAQLPTLERLQYWLGRKVDITTPATPEEQEDAGVESFGGRGVIVEVGENDDGLFVVTDYGYGFPVRSDTTIIEVGLEVADSLGKTPWPPERCEQEIEGYLATLQTRQAGVSLQMARLTAENWQSSADAGLFNGSYARLMAIAYWRRYAELVAEHRTTEAAREGA